MSDSANTAVLGFCVGALLMTALGILFHPDHEPRVPTAAEYVMCERAMRGAAYTTDSLAIKRLHPTDDGPSCGEVLEYGHKGAWPREGEPFTSTAP